MYPNHVSDQTIQPPELFMTPWLGQMLENNCAPHDTINSPYRKLYLCLSDCSRKVGTRCPLTAVSIAYCLKAEALRPFPDITKVVDIKMKR